MRDCYSVPSLKYGGRYKNFICVEQQSGFCHLGLCPSVTSMHVEVIVSVNTFSTLHWLHVFIVLAYILQGYNFARHCYLVSFSYLIYFQ